MGTDSTGEAAWREWKAQCALDLCSKTTAAHLRQFGGRRFRRYVERCLPKSGPGRASADVLSPRDAWHRFEVHLCVRESRAGKRYKEWLFQRADPHEAHWERIVEAGATVLMRTVVREFLRHEHAVPWMRSLQDPLLGSDGTPLTLEDLLPGTLDPSDEAERKEIEEAAGHVAGEILSDLSSRERIAVAARDSGVSLSHSDVLKKAAGCQKSALYTAYRKVFHKIAARVQEDAEKATASEQAAFGLLIYDRLKNAIISQSAPEFRTLCFSMDMDGAPTRKGKARYGSTKQ